MTETAYAAHIITGDATAMGNPEIIVMTQADETGAADPLISYPLGDRDALAAANVLYDSGWYTTSDLTHVEPGYVIVDVTPANWPKIIASVTFTREAAEVERTRCDNAWRTVIRDAMNDDESATEIATVANISRERVYQIRDGRR